MPPAAFLHPKNAPKSWRLGLRPRPYWGAYSAAPDPIAGLREPTSKGRGGKVREGRGDEGLWTFTMLETDWRPWQWDLRLKISMSLIGCDEWKLKTKFLIKTFPKRRWNFGDGENDISCSVDPRPRCGRPQISHTTAAANISQERVFSQLSLYPSCGCAFLHTYCSLTTIKSTVHL